MRFPFYFVTIKYLVEEVITDSKKENKPAGLSLPQIMTTY